MIYIIDNGLDFSEHALYFVETDVPITLERLEFKYDFPEIVGVASEIKWRVNESMPLKDFAHAISRKLSGDLNGVRAEEIVKLMTVTT